LPTGGALAVVLLLCALIAIPTVQLVLVALLVKHVFAATITGFLGRDGRAGAALTGNLLALSVEYFKSLD
jgi:predicted anti-sigma-YlaC factor YlaD